MGRKVKDSYDSRYLNSNMGPIVRTGSRWAALSRSYFKKDVDSDLRIWVSFQLGLRLWLNYKWTLGLNKGNPEARALIMALPSRVNKWVGGQAHLLQQMGI